MATFLKQIEIAQWELEHQAEIHGWEIDYEKMPGHKVITFQLKDKTKHTFICTI